MYRRSCLVIVALVLFCWTAACGATELTQLTFDPDDEFYPAWSPDGATVAFCKGNDIWLVPAIGGSPYLLTGQPRDESRPSWSPDGTMIAFSTNWNGEYDIYVMPASGGTAERITTSPFNEDYPAWSPDGEKIAFEWDSSGTTDLWMVDLGSGTLQQITDDAGYEEHPSWSADSRTVVYYKDGDLFTVDVEGGSPSLFLENGIVPSWSRDGTRMVYQNNDGLWYADFPSGNPHLIVSGNRTHSGSWAPDGQSCAFMRDTGSGYDIWLAAGFIESTGAEEMSWGSVKSLFR